MATRTFYGIVAEQDLYKDRPVDPESPPKGPILMETYLGELATDRAAVEALLPNFKRYGWVRLATITVDIPEV